MSSTIPLSLSPREQLCNGHCSNKQQLREFFSESGPPAAGFPDSDGPGPLLLSGPEPASESRFHPGRGESTSSSGSDLEAPGPPVLSEWLSLSSASSGEEEVEREEEEERRRNSVKERIRGEEEEEKEENGGGRRREEQEQEEQETERGGRRRYKGKEKWVQRGGRLGRTKTKIYSITTSLPPNTTAWQASLY